MEDETGFFFFIFLLFFFLRPTPFLLSAAVAAFSGSRFVFDLLFFLFPQRRIGNPIKLGHEMGKRKKKHGKTRYEPIMADVEGVRNQISN